MTNPDTLKLAKEIKTSMDGVRGDILNLINERCVGKIERRVVWWMLADLLITVVMQTYGLGELESAAMLELEFRKFGERFSRPLATQTHQDH